MYSSNGSVVNDGSVNDLWPIDDWPNSLVSELITNFANSAGLHADDPVMRANGVGDRFLKVLRCRALWRWLVCILAVKGLRKRPSPLRNMFAKGGGSMNVVGFDPNDLHLAECAEAEERMGAIVTPNDDWSSPPLWRGRMYFYRALYVRRKVKLGTLRMHFEFRRLVDYLALYGIRR